MKLRWFRFTLRTFFVLLTLLCVWLGVQMEWIRQRRAFLRDRTAELWQEDHHITPLAPGPLWCFGESGIHAFNKGDWTQQEIKRIGELFPEALIISYNENGLTIYKFAGKKPHPDGRPVSP